MEGRNKKGQFEKGQSGNPAGRPRNFDHSHRSSPARRKVVLEVAEKVVTTRDGQELTYLQAVQEALARKAMSGHHPSMKLFLEQHRAAADVNGELNVLANMLLDEVARLQLENEAMKKKIEARGLVMPEISEDQWRRLSGEFMENWEKRKDFYGPR